MAAVAPLLPPIMTYVEKFEQTPDPFSATLPSFFEPFSPTNNQQNAMVRNSVFTSEGPKIFVVLSQGEIVVLHRLTTFAPVLGQQTTFDNGRYCFRGDVTNVGQVAVANWLDAAFTPVAGVRVQTLAMIDGEITAAQTNNTGALGPLGAAAAGTELIAVRMVCPVPISYAPLIMLDEVKNV